jgi:signal transduction histidine kinase
MATDPGKGDVERRASAKAAVSGSRGAISVGVIELCRTLAEQMPAAVVVTQGPEHHLRYVNPAFGQLAGEPPAKLLGRSFTETLPASRPSGVAALLDQVYHTGEPAVASDRGLETSAPPSSSPSLVWTASISPILDSGGRVAGLLAQMTDTAAQLLAQCRYAEALGSLRAVNQQLVLSGVRELELTEAAERLAAENARLLGLAEATAQQSATERDWLQGILDELPEGVLIIDPEGQIILCNAAMAANWGLPPGEPLPSRRLADYQARGVYHPDGSPLEPEMDPLLRALQGEVVHGQQVLAAQLDGGRLVPLLCGAAPLRDRSGAASGAVGVYQDITAMRDMERDKDEFLASVSHDLRTPLTAIKGWTQLLGRQATRTQSISQEFAADFLRGVDVAVEHLIGLIESLLDLSRLQMGRALDLNREPMDLVAVARSAAGALQQVSAVHTILVESTVDELAGHWDKFRLQRVLANLISNAIKYSPDGGTVRLSVARDHAAEDWARLTLQDGGVGIPVVDLPHIFERFYRGSNVKARIAGTGIGLAGVKQIIEQHGGTIVVESEEGRGTRVTVRLPCSERPPA